MNYTRQPSYLTGRNGADGVEADDIYEEKTYGPSGDTPRQSLYELPTYINPHHTLHNNIGERVLNEQIFNNKLFIDTAFRDYARNPDPFRFVIKFNGLRPVIETVSVSALDRTFSYPKYISGDTDIVVDRVFQNVKKIIIDGLILPHTLNYVTDSTGAYRPSDARIAKNKYKYIILKISELSNTRFFSNSPHLSNDSFIMKLDTQISTCNDLWIPINVNSNHYQAAENNLTKLDRLTVEITNDCSERLCPTLDGRPHDFFADYRRTIDRIYSLHQINTNASQSQAAVLFPKLLALCRITEKIVPELHLTVSTLEAHINTAPQYRN